MGYMKLYTDLCEGGAWSNGNLVSKKDNKNIDPLKDRSFSFPTPRIRFLVYHFFTNPKASQRKVNQLYFYLFRKYGIIMEDAIARRDQILKLKAEYFASNKLSDIQGGVLKNTAQVFFS